MQYVRHVHVDAIQVRYNDPSLPPLQFAIVISVGSSNTILQSGEDGHPQEEPTNFGPDHGEPVIHKTSDEFPSFLERHHLNGRSPTYSKENRVIIGS